MKRDMDLIRKVLFHVEANDNLDFALEGYNEQTIAYHVWLLNEAELLHAIAIPVLDGTIQLQDGFTSLTWDGHEFLEASRNETFWKNAKKRVKEKTGGLSFDVLKAALAKLAIDAIS